MTLHSFGIPRGSGEEIKSLTQTQIYMIIAFVILIAFSAFFSSAETSFVSVSKIRVKTAAEDENDPNHERALVVSDLMDNQDRVISTILVGNNLVNIGASSLTTSFIISIFGNQGTWVTASTFFVTLVILIFGEITPKTMAAAKAEEMVYKFCPFLKVIYTVFSPVVIVLTALTHGVLHLLGVKTEEGPTLSQEDLKTIVNVSHEEGVLEDEEKEMLHNVFEFGDTDIEAIMTPRINVETIGLDDTYDEMRETFRENQFSRFPVWDQENDEIVGVLNIKDLMMAEPINPDGFKVSDYMREAFYVYEFNHIDSVFAQMRKEHVSLAIVLDEYGVMSGIVAMEDIVEEIVGEIDDEFDDDSANAIVDLNDNQYLIDGVLDIDEVNEHCGTKFETEDFESIGGLVLGEMQGVPEVRAQVTIDGCLFTVERVDKNRIISLKLKVPVNEDKDEEEKPD